MLSLWDYEEAAHAYRFDEFEERDSVVPILRLLVGRYQQVEVSDVEHALCGPETIVR